VGQDAGEQLQGVQGLAWGVVVAASCQVENGTGVGRQAEAGETDRGDRVLTAGGKAPRLLEL